VDSVSPHEEIKKATFPSHWRYVIWRADTVL
jgi:hypothetical protein